MASPALDPPSEHRCLMQQNKNQARVIISHLFCVKVRSYKNEPCCNESHQMTQYTTQHLALFTKSIKAPSQHEQTETISLSKHVQISNHCITCVSQNLYNYSHVFCHLYPK